MVGGRGQGAVGTLAQWVLGLVELDALIRRSVRRVDGRTAGAVVVKFPGSERAVLADAAGHVDDAGRAEVRPGEFLLARPDELYGLAGGLGEPGGFEGVLAGVLAAVRGAHVGHDDPNLIRVQLERAGQV